LQNVSQGTNKTWKKCKENADVNAKNKKGKTPLDLAIDIETKRIIKLETI
jgi:hypothetical protein